MNLEADPRPADLQVRLLTAADGEAWRALYVDYLAVMGQPLPAAAIERIFQRLTRGEAVRGLLAVGEGRAVGFAHYLFHANVHGADLAYLQDLFTAAPDRGRGVGRALIGAVAAAARQHGCARLYWHTGVDNVTARHLYDDVAEHLGAIRYELEL